MSDVLQIVDLTDDGRAPQKVLDIADDKNFFTNGLNLGSGASRPVTAQLGGRWGGTRVVADSHDNVTHSWECRVIGSTSADCLDKIEALLSAIDAVRIGRYIKYRAEDALYPTYFELRGPSSWTPKYVYAELAGACSMVIELQFQCAPLALGDSMDIYEDFSPRGSVIAENLITNPSFEPGITDWHYSAAAYFTNGIRNPSLETNTTDWSFFVGSGSGTPTRVTSDGWQGSACYEVAGTGLTASSNIQAYQEGAATSGLATTVGDVVFFSVAVKVQAAAAAGGQIRVLARYLNSSGAFVANVELAVSSRLISSPVVGRWYVLSGWATTPSNAGITQVTTQIVYDVPATAGAYTMRVDAASAVKVPSTSVAAPYFDGSSVGAYWTGTAHASSSQLATIPNHVKNPSFEVDTSGWTGNSIAATVFARQTGWSAVGSASLRMTFTTPAGNSWPGAQGDSTQYVKVVPGVTYTFSALLNVLTVSSGTLSGEVNFMDDAGNVVGSTAFFPALTGTGIKNMVVSATAPAGAVRVRWVIYNASTGAGTFDAYLDAMQITATPIALSYFDGSANGGVWSGTAHASESYLGILSQTTISPFTGSKGSAQGRFTARVPAGAYATAQFYQGSTGSIRVVGGRSYYVSCAVYVSALSGSSPLIKYDVWWYDAAGVLLGASGGGSHSTTGAGTIGGLVTAPTGAAFAVPNILTDDVQTGMSYYDAYVDAVLFTEATAAVNYFDGDQDRAAWTGQAHASTSRLYDAGSLDDWTGINTTYFGAASGQLVPQSLGVEQFALHSARGYQVADAQVTVKAFAGTAGTDAVPYVVSAMPKRITGPLTGIYAYVAEVTAGATLNIAKFSNGAFVGLAGSGAFATRPSALGTYWWVRGRIEGNVFMAEYWATEPTPGGTPTATLTYPLTTAEQQIFGSGVVGGQGFTAKANDRTFRVDDVRIEPYTYSNRVFPDSIDLSAIPGTAPALADIVVQKASGRDHMWWECYGWAKKPDVENLVWNGDFETNNAGWSVAVIAGITNAGTSITRDTTAAKFGSASGLVTVPGTATDERGWFRIYRRFRKGVTYTAELWVRSSSGTPTVSVNFGVLGDAGLGSYVTTTSSFQRITVAWTPTADRTDAYILVGPGAAAGSSKAFQIDGVQVYEGTVAPTNGRQAEGQGALAPIGVIGGEYTNAPGTNGTVTADANAHGGFVLRGAVGLLTGKYWLAPSLLLADDFTEDLTLEVWARLTLPPATTSPIATLSVTPSGGATYYSNEWGSVGRTLTVQSGGGTVPQVVRLGSVTMPSQLLRQHTRHQLQVAVTNGGGTQVDLDYIFIVPTRSRAAGTSGKPTSTVPFVLSSLSSAQKRTRSDLAGRRLVGTLDPRMEMPAPGLGGSLIELPPGDVRVASTFAAYVPDDPTVDSSSANDNATYGAKLIESVHYAIRPRYRLVRGS